MNKLIGLGIGLAVGAVIGVAVVALFAPISGKALRREIKRGYDDTMEEARIASETKQRELEAELAFKMRRPS